MLCDSFRQAKLIRTNNDEESLLKCFDNIFFCFIKEQLICFPNSRKIINTWIHSTSELLDEVIASGRNPMNEMSSAKLTSIFKSVDEKCISVTNKTLKDVISYFLSKILMDQCRIFAFQV